VKYSELKQIIREALLNEVRYEDALKLLDGKKFKKMIKRWSEYWYFVPEEPEEHVEQYYENIVNFFKKSLISSFQSIDLEDKQKATALMWFLKYLRNKSVEDMKWVEIYGGLFVPSILNTTQMSNLRRHLEKFFHWQQFMNIKDLNQISSPEHLTVITWNANEKIKAYQEKQANADAEQGTEVLMDNDKWTIAAIHNKGAACQLGKGTDWCTAAPGLDYFSDYYSPNDPLFYFHDKKNNEKFQFHYGTKSFMNARDQRVGDDMFYRLNTLLSKTDAKKYDAFYKHHYWLGRAGDKDITREEWQKIKNMNRNHPGYRVYNRYLKYNPTAQQYEWEWENENIYF
jgi:hypothetical protein